MKVRKIEFAPMLLAIIIFIWAGYHFSAESYGYAGIYVMIFAALIFLANIIYFIFKFVFNKYNFDKDDNSDNNRFEMAYFITISIILFIIIAFLSHNLVQIHRRSISMVCFSNFIIEIVSFIILTILILPVYFIRGKESYKEVVKYAFIASTISVIFWFFIFALRFIKID